MSTRSTPSLTPSRSPTPSPPVQPDHFYSLDSNNDSLPPSPDSDGHSWLSPEDDPFATKGIPVFKPTMEEFQDFEDYMNKVECWGMKSGIVKIIPPKEWTDSLPSLNPQLAKVRLRSPIEQMMLGNAGLYRQQNVEKNRHMSVREWAEMCKKEDWRAPTPAELELKAADNPAKGVQKKRQKKKADVEAEVELEVEDAATPDVKLDDDASEIIKSSIDADADVDVDTEMQAQVDSIPTPPPSEGDEHGSHHEDQEAMQVDDDKQTSEKPEDDKQASVEGDAEDSSKPASRKKRAAPTRASREAALAHRAKLDVEFLETFDPHKDWLPENMTAEDYTPEFCAKLERKFWRNLGWGRCAWYGADMAGSLFTSDTTSWNVASLPSALTRLLPANTPLPGVNTPYLYFGMWRATFAWHVEDMDLFSINYIHFGAGKFWYAIPQGRAVGLENAMKSYFPRDGSKCNQFLRHKSYLASPTLLAKNSCRPNVLVQHAGEFVITYPRGYHAGFNLGFNCAESVNFALESWLDLGRKAGVCDCVGDSVRIDVDQLLHDREEERVAALKKAEKEKEKTKVSKKRKPDISDTASSSSSPSKAKKAKLVKPSSSSTASTPSSSIQKVTLKLPPKPKEPTPFPCCLCISMSTDGLLRVHDKPRTGICQNVPPREKVVEVAEDGREVVREMEVWRAHEGCAKIVPETWIDEVEVDGENGEVTKEQVVFGVDAIVKDRWNLKCSSCTKTRQKTHGAPIQCTKGKCSKAFHVSCAREGEEMGIAVRFEELREVEKQVVLVEPKPAKSVPASSAKSADVNADVAMLDNTVDGFESSSGSAEAQVQPEPSGPTVVKVIKKTEYELLCPQHNPILAALKKANKTDKVRKDLLALPEGSRIKLRVTAGVFEVTLVRVIEERGTVEVLWDGGHKKEFKWGSVVWGVMEGQSVGQKPTVAAPPSAAPNPNVSTYRVNSNSQLGFSKFQAQGPATYNPHYSPYSPAQYGGYPMPNAYVTGSSMPPYGYPYPYAQAIPNFSYNPYASYAAYGGYGAPSYSRYYPQASHASMSIPPTNGQINYPHVPAGTQNLDQQTPVSGSNSNPVSPVTPNAVPPEKQTGDSVLIAGEEYKPSLQDAMRDVRAMSILPQAELEELLKTKPSIRESVRIVMAHREAQKS